MRLDNARNAKAEIFKQAFGYAEETAAFSDGSIPVFVPQRLEGSATLEAIEDPRLDVAIGIAPPPGGESGSRASREAYQVVMLVQKDDSEAYRLAEQARAITRGEVRVVHTGPVEAQSHWQPARRRPLRPGLSCGHFSITSGTLGGFVRVNGGRVCILSNNHVLADVNAGSAGDAILQPGDYDGGLRPGDETGTLLDFEPIAFGADTVNFMDAAIAAIGEAVETDRDYPDGSGAPTRISGVRAEAVDVEDRLFKVGRTTGFTEGEVFAIEVDQLIVNMGSPAAPRRARFDNQFQVYSRTGHFSRPGDSGSLVVDSEGRVAGLLFAGSNSGAPSGYGLTSVNPIAPVLGRFGATIWTG